MRTQAAARLSVRAKPQAHAESQITPDDPCPWDYADVCAFLICVVTLGTAVRLAVTLHLLSSIGLGQSSALFQAVLCSCVLLALYATLRIRHGGPVWRALGWTLPSGRCTVVALLGGILLAGAVTFVARSSGIPAPFAIGWQIVALSATIGPVLEESFFRGCLFPLMARTMGAPAAVILIAILFALFHQPPTILHCVCYCVTGIAYGWMRAASKSTMPAALMHAVYNLTLIVCQNF